MRRFAVGLTVVLAGGAVALAAAGLGMAQDAAPPFSNSASPTVVVPPPVLPPPSAVKPGDSPSLPAEALPPEEPTPPKPAAAPKAEEPPPPPKTPPVPLKRPRYDAAILQGVDKITAQTLRFEARVGEPVRYKGLILTVHVCETTAADEAMTDSVANVDVQSQPVVFAGRGAAPPRQVFKGWMFASSPTLHPFQHPIYDLWLIACKASAPVAKG